MDKLTVCRSDARFEFCGAHSGFIPCADGLRLSPGAEEGTFLSMIYDSGETDRAWNRLTLSIDGTGTLLVRLVVSNDRRDCLRLSDEPDAAESMPHAHHARDILLYTDGRKGRYLRFLLTLTAPPGCMVTLRAFSASFPKQTFTDYLPALYAGNETLERFYAVFQSVYLELEEQITCFPAYLDPSTAPPDFLPVLGAWLGVPDILRALPSPRLRRVVENAALLGRLSGSAACVRLLCSLLTDQIPVCVAEYARWSESAALRRIYGESPACLLVVLRGAADAAGRAAFSRALGQYLPAGVHARVQFLDEPAHSLRGCCYLGINARLAARIPAALDGQRLDGQPALLTEGGARR